MLRPIIFETDHFLVHPLRQIDIERHDKIIEDIYEILSNEDVLQFIPEKRLKNIDDAKKLMIGIVLAYQTQRNFTHFITIKEINKVIGIIDVFPPATTKETYKTLSEYNWMIEYYLNQRTWDRGIMSELLPIFKALLMLQGINKVGAICKEKNYGSISVLEKSGFKKKMKIDSIQHYYEAIQ